MYHSKFKEVYFLYNIIKDSRNREEALDKTLRDSDRENHRLATDINRLTE